jgi:DNA repair exonuclease SbcCD nuclease subunit
MFKFLHAADIHLDSPLQGLPCYDGAPVEALRRATRRAFENLVQFALDERVAFVLIAGDLYDGDWKDYNTGLYFMAQMSRLREADIPVYLITGNHDAANRMTRALRLPDNVAMLSTEEPETRVLEDLGVAIHGMGFATRAVTDDLSARYPHAQRGYFNIGLLHTCATGREGHEPYAPCTIDGLRFRHYDYWALGHIHQRERLHVDAVSRSRSMAPIHFPGNLQGRHIREAGAKGCLLLTVRDGKWVEEEFRCLDVLRWERCPIDAPEAADGDAVVERVADGLRALRQDNEGKPLAVRVEVHGPCPAHEQLLADPQRWTNEVRSRAIEVGGGDLWIEKVKLRTTPPTTASPLAVDGPLGELLGILEEYQSEDNQLRQLGQELAELERKLPAELKQGPDGFRLDDPAWLRGVLEQVQPLLVHRLLCRGKAR